MLCVLFNEVCSVKGFYHIFIILRKCLNHPDTFCYLRGELTGEILPRSLRNVISITLGEKWTTKIKVEPLIYCVTCVWLLTGWVRGWRQMPFAVPMV